jgi:hypothetical protein
MLELILVGAAMTYVAFKMRARQRALIPIPGSDSKRKL